MNWLYVIIGAIIAELGKMFYVIAKRAIYEHRRKKIIAFVTATFPDNSSITFASISSSEKKAMDEVVKQLREQGTLSDEDLDEYEMEPFPERK